MRSSVGENGFILFRWRRSIFLWSQNVIFFFNFFFYRLFIYFFLFQNFLSRRNYYRFNIERLLPPLSCKISQIPCSNCSSIGRFRGKVCFNMGELRKLLSYDFFCFFSYNLSRYTTRYSSKDYNILYIKYPVHLKNSYRKIITHLFKDCFCCFIINT